MNGPRTIRTAPERAEQVLLVIIEDQHNGGWSADDIADELTELVEGCRGRVAERVFCPVKRPSPATFVGSGKLKQIADFCAERRIDTVVFSKDLKGSQQRNIEGVVRPKTIDRTQLILDIFARHATSQEGKMQVELAQLQYLLPRLVGKGIALSRLGGGIGTLGPGETKLEVDRRRINQRIGKLQQGLREVAAERGLKRKRRRERGLPVISLVGYTNAGKSTLLNALTTAGQVTRDSLFTTLDPLSRQLILPNHLNAVISDTVGFMHDLPHHLIESFKATLEEVTEADLLLLVLDVSHPNFRNRHDSVMDVLGQLGAADKPTVTVLNKIDRLPAHAVPERVRSAFANPVSVSAATGENLDLLRDAMSQQLSSVMMNVEVMLPIGRMDLVHRAHEEGTVFSVKYYNDRIHLRALLPTALAGLLYKEEAEHNERSPRTPEAA